MPTLKSVQENPDTASFNQNLSSRCQQDLNIYNSLASFGVKIKFNIDLRQFTFYLVKIIFQHFVESFFQPNYKVKKICST